MSDSDQKEAQVARVRRTLDDWKEVLVLGKKVLDWEQPYHPGVIFGLVTLHFLVIECWLEPSMTALLSITLLKLTLADYLMPFLGPKIFPMENWGSEQEHEFNVICDAVVGARYDVVDAVRGLYTLKGQRPRVYMALSIGFLLTTAWLGSTFGDAFICYALTLFALLYPGAKKKGIVEAYFADVVAKVKEVVFKEKSV